MKKDKIKICFFELLIIMILFFALFAPNILPRSVLAIIMAIYAFIVCKMLKRRKIDSIYKKQITILMIIFAVIYLGVFYAFGIYFGFTRSSTIFSLWTIKTFIIPLTILIVSSEIIRKIFLSQDFTLEFKNIKLNISLILTYIFGVLVDFIVYFKIYDLTDIDDFLIAIGFVLFASLSCNLLYNYLSKRYDAKGIICYRLITVLFMYIIPVIPDFYIFFRSFLRMLYPYVMYLIIDKMYSRNDYVVAYSEKKKEAIGTASVVVIITLIIMLISCQFKYGLLVIGSESMTGAINKGDAILYEKYENQPIEVGQVIMFEYNNMKVIHRVIEIKEVNGIIRYYTKGDANAKIDTGYRTNQNIQGLVKFKVKYLGQPTLFFRKLFK